MKKYMLGAALVVFLFGCNSKEKTALRHEVDSLTIQLTASRVAEESMNEVGLLIDSIDANRKSLQLKMVEGSSYADYVTRLRNINTYVKETETKLDVLEKSVKSSSNASAASIRRLRADLNMRTQEILGLQLELEKAREENQKAWAKINEKDSLLLMKDQIIKVNESAIATLEKLVSDTREDNKIAVANLYFEQAQAMEEAANRTQFAPRKKKEARLEALELYRLSLSLGKLEALIKINELEGKLN
jgi:hypothetical protein